MLPLMSPERDLAEFFEKCLKIFGMRNAVGGGGGGASFIVDLW